MSRSWITLIACFSVCQCCAVTTADAHDGLVTSLVSYAGVSSAKDRRTALYLLARINLEPANIDRVEATCKTFKAEADELFCAYFTYSRKQSLPAASEFVHKFPSSQASLDLVLNNSLRVELPTELIDLLGNLAATDDAALKKLVVASRSADGWVAESLNAALRDLSSRNPERVSRVRNELPAANR